MVLRRKNYVLQTRKCRWYSGDHDQIDTCGAPCPKRGSVRDFSLLYRGSVLNRDVCALVRGLTVAPLLVSLILPKL